MPAIIIWYNTVSHNMILCSLATGWTLSVNHTSDASTGFQGLPVLHYRSTYYSTVDFLYDGIMIIAVISQGYYLSDFVYNWHL